MGDSVRPYARAASIKATVLEREQEWEVHRYRKVGKGGDWQAQARVRTSNDLTSEERRSREKLLEKHDSQNETTEHEGAGEAWRRVGQNMVFDFEYELFDRDSPSYSPISEKPALFLEFSQLADSGNVSVYEWFKWVETYGALGPDDCVDIYSRFAKEALLASRVRRLFEATIREPKPDIEVLDDLTPILNGSSYEASRKCDISHEKLEDAEDAALQIVGYTVERKLREECYPELFVKSHHRSRGNKRRSTLRQGWQFRSLLGAMWLQFMWRVDTHVIEHCVMCGKRIPRHKYRNAITCKGACRTALSRELNRTS